MSLLEQHDLLVRKKLAAMPQGNETGLAEIFGDGWKQIGVRAKARLNRSESFF
jgi:hypothetical protein